MIYSPVDYSMGTDAISVPANAEVEPSKAKAELAKMKRSLKNWLRWRGKSDAVAEGKIKPKKGKMPPGQFKQLLRQERHCDEQALADHLYTLLSECFDPKSLPDADVRENPEAAVELAVIAVSGKLPDESVSPEEQGIIWMWPLVLVVGAVAFVITSKIRNDAELAMEKERTRCIQEAGWMACDEYAFLKLGALGIGAFFAYNYFTKKNRKRAK